ncbi:MAG: SDR family oxidoreductase [Dehalococcoidia bacterium]|nr:SDR family oxidoreductase [Dehalococcoidia bacterium]
MTKTTLIVGAAGGIGRATAALLAAQGDRIIPLDRADGVDAADPDAVAAFLADKPPVDRLVHLAGTTLRGGIDTYSLADWDRMLRDNLTSAFVVAQAVLPMMRAQGGGAMVFASSTAGRNGGSRLTGIGYAAAKAGLIGLTRHLAIDLARDNIRVNCVAPGPVDTPMIAPLSEAEINSYLVATPIARLTQPEEVAAAIAFLLADTGPTMTGVVLDINGGRWMG